MNAPTPHPAHDELTETLPSWYTRSYPDMGYRTERGNFAFYSTNTQVSPDAPVQVIVGRLPPSQIQAFLDEVRGRCKEGPARIYVTDRQTDAELGPALVAAGFLRDNADVFLAHVAPPPARGPASPSTIEKVVESNLREFAMTKLMGFANSEAMPSPSDLQEELAIRSAEMAGAGDFLLARHMGQPAAVIGWYDDGKDRYVFLLATRPAFRRRGIARQLLEHAIRDAYDQGRRSVIISADPDDTPIRFYRRMGFVDEVYWRQGYHGPVASAAGNT